MAGKKMKQMDERVSRRTGVRIRLLVCLLVGWFPMPFDIFMRIGHLKDKCEPTNQDNGNIKTKSIQTRANPLNKFSSSAVERKQTIKVSSFVFGFFFCVTKPHIYLCILIHCVLSSLSSSSSQFLSKLRHFYHQNLLVILIKCPKQQYQQSVRDHIKLILCVSIKFYQLITPLVRQIYD